MESLKYLKDTELVQKIAGMKNRETKIKRKVKESESEVAQSCPTPCDPMDYSPPGSSVHWIFQARVTEAKFF